MFSICILTIPCKNIGQFLKDYNTSILQSNYSMKLSLILFFFISVLRFAPIYFFSCFVQVYFVYNIFFTHLKHLNFYKKYGTIYLFVSLWIFDEFVLNSINTVRYSKLRHPLITTMGYKIYISSLCNYTTYGTNFIQFNLKYKSQIKV